MPRTTSTPTHLARQLQHAEFTKPPTPTSTPYVAPRDGVDSGSQSCLLRQYLHEMFDLRVETVGRVARRLGALQERLRARDVGGEGREVVGGERDRVRRLTQ